MTTNRAFEIRSGYSHTLGANYDGEGVNFAIFSAHAERVELCLYDPSGEHEIARLELPEYTDEIWHGYVPKLQPGALYGYRVYGPYDPENGHRFNPNKLLIDPYARELVGDIQWNDAHFAYQLLHDDKDLTFDDQDSAPFTPKCRVMDSLRYWAESMHVDGFRFDLGTILGREPEGFDQRGGFFDAVTQDPVLAKLKLIGEPWDIGPGGYQVGGFPPGWGEWNDKYRDTVREYWKGDNVTNDFAARLLGSGDLYDLRGRRPWSSVNFITAHDGFTLNDLVSYNDKHNEANGEDNNDGHNDNRSCNYGAEGPTDDEGINAIREQQKRNFLTTLLFSHGTPMLLAGDEFGRSQMGNNNGYCQDSEISWVHWDNLPETANALREFTRHLIQLRATQPLLRRESWRDGLEIRWFNAGGGAQQSEQWDEGSTIGVCISRPDLQPEAGIWHDALLLFNPFEGSVPFRIPMWGEGGWVLELTTADNAQQGMRITEEMDFDLAGRSIVLFRRP
ncbi:hypothetical protein LYY82_000468 [Salmonella enterica subsp. enterica serovar Schwarzengrund]|nr:hypothetical protein [Salmonella enterica subsp. enterica serovar Schwarzengrund]EHG9399031.1 hypothetical protein [Salmonella enterica subsp. enterica serovar Schwarzengrund]EHH1530821.1 hypothetical protein [Salmonella enterica subsp. enterica serovar Schwarzengrund]EIR9917455.1 hypothetical protein [Salmonella enterica subsp. enterica serovar Schwarzengrund]EIV4708547.1 hypothetical protein [Salmonella enterica]